MEAWECGYSEMAEKTIKNKLKKSYMVVAPVIAAVFYFVLGDVLITALTEIVGSKEEAKKVLKGVVIFILCIAIVISALTK